MSLQNQGKSEGISLKENILEKLDSLSKAVDEVEARAPQIVEEYRTKAYGKGYGAFSRQEG